MSLLEILRLGLSSLRAARARTLLTVLGVAVATAALATMVAGGKGLQDNFRARMVDSGFLLNIAVFPDSERNDAGPVARAAALDDRSLAKLRAIPGVARVTRDIRLPVGLQSDKGRAEGIAIGIRQEVISDLAGGELTAGAWFTGEDASLVVVSEAIARTLGYASESAAVGEAVTLRLGGPTFARMISQSSPFGIFSGTLRISREYRIAGVMARERMGFGSLGASILVPYGQAAGIQADLLKAIPMASRLGTSFSATVRLHRSADLERVDEAITGMGYSTFSAVSFVKRARPFVLLVEGLVFIIGSIGLAIACLGITNTLITEVFERTREIGILKAVGAEDRDVIRLFLGQSALYGLLGGLLGLLLAFGLAAGVTAVADWYFRQNGADTQQLFAFPPWLVLGALALSVGTSVLAAIYPALRAA
ncbi:MAG: ABC transporter permease, partial [Candidatus Sericytochromatia bacterium]|nr:ABC transporter permease [Candidatus Tanganyikabacteria bacterium]